MGGDGQQPKKLGPYLILGELGRGAMGVVYRARHHKLDREVALKVMQVGTSITKEALGRFQREARAASALADHPNVVGVHDIGEADGRSFFAMELVKGPSLEQLIKGDGLTVDDALRIMGQASRAVQHAHDNGILHRDLKPGNILTTHTGDAKVADFGLAKSQEADAESMRLTKSGAILGTPAYMSPEQSVGDPAEPRSDVYSLGATLYEALAGSPPFETDSLYNLLSKIQRVDPDPVRTLNPDVPTDVETIVAKALEKEPHRRYQSAGELADDIDRARAGEPILAKPPGALSLMMRRLRRRKGLVVSGALGVVALVIVSALLLPQVFAAKDLAAREAERAAKAKREAEAASEREAAARKSANLRERRAQEAEAALSDAAKRAREAERAKDEASAKAAAERERAAMAAGEAAATAKTATEREAAAREAIAAAEKERVAAERERAIAADAVKRVRTAEAAAAESLRVAARTAFEAMAELARVGAPARGERFLPRLEAACDQIEQLVPDSAEPHLLRARAYHALFRLDDALAQLDAAVAKAPDLVEARFERLVVGARQARQDADGAAVPAALRAKLDEDAARVSKASDATPAQKSAAEGLAALVAGKHQAAYDAFTKATYSDPSMLVALEGLAVSVAALGQPEEAVTWWGKVMELDAGYRPAWIARAELNLEAADKDWEGAGARLELSLHDFGRCLAASADHGRARAGRARTLQLLAVWRSQHDAPIEDWAGLFGAAIADWDLALHARGVPADTRPALRRVGTLIDWGTALSRGDRGDPTGPFEQAVAALDAMRPQSGDAADIALLRGRVNHSWGDWMRVYHKGDPRDRFRAALADFETALRIEPRNDEAMSMVAVLHIGFAIVARKYQEDPEPSFREGTKQFKALTRMDAKNAGAWGGLGDAYHWWARDRIGQGRDPLRELRESAEAFERAIALQPNDARMRRDRGEVLLKAGVYLQDKKGDARGPLQAAAEELTQATALESEDWRGWLMLGQSRYRLAWARGHKHNEVDATFQAAIEAFDQCARISRERAEAWRERGEAYLLWARSLEARRKSPADQWKSAFSAFNEAARFSGGGDDELKKRIKLCEAWIAQNGGK